jgi:hypothetical protein
MLIFTKRTPLAFEWTFRSTFGHYRGRCSDRVFANWGLADGVFAHGIFADRRGHGLRLRSWEVGSDRCAHESQTSDTENDEF